MRAVTVKLGALFLLLLTEWMPAAAQNSPYSRYGLGDLTDGRNAINQAMGGVSQAYADGQSLNFNNPASYANLQLTTLDVGMNGSFSTLSDKGNNTFHSGSASLSYLQLGVPLKRGGGWGLNFGLVPVSKMDYNIRRHDTLTEIGTGVDKLYQGTGGLYQAFIGTGVRIKGIRLGINAGYLFGSLEHSEQFIYPNDTLHLYSSDMRQNTSFGSFFWSAGAQAHIKLASNLHLELGASGSSRQNLSARRSLLQETFFSSGDPSDPSPQNLDTVKYEGGEKGKIIYPQQLRFGILLHDNEHWMLGADYEMGQWDDYRFYKTTDSVQNNWKLRIGGQFIPNATASGKGYWSRVAYRAGIYTGSDYLLTPGGDLNVFAFTFGAGLPIRNFVPNARGQFTTLNLGFEVGKRGGDSNPLSERFFRINLGLDLSDIWFNKNKFR
ncbi:outer membrane protein transport protein [Compostibacter hankyongensis]|uniref:Outer membrane protein transport protein n=2 Tax=Compostibacter hankyongensis TaxID=1007089 RepID=A0ABP8FDK0_9BACT